MPRRLPRPASLLLPWLIACSGDSPPPEAPAPEAPPAEEAAKPAPVARATGPSLILVTMDTTRVDHIGAYGYTQGHTPNIDAVAAQGIRFSQAYAVVPLTTPAHASMLSGLYPTRHGIHSNGDAVLSDDVQTLAEHLSQRGYHTAASVSAFVTTRTWNLDQGFDQYFDAVDARAGERDRRWSRERPAGDVVADLEKWLAQKPPGEAFFAWAHFYDPHAPYEPPAPWAEQLAGRPYDGEIAYMDEQIGRLRALAEAAAGEAGVAIILVADHGEAFGEHGETGHGTWIYEPTMRIPFVVKPPRPAEGAAAGRAIDGIAVSNVDVMPTALGLLGIETPGALDGRDLSALTRGESAALTPERGPVYLESETVYTRFGFHPEWAAVEGAWKLFATPALQMFNVVEDRAEEKDRRTEPDQAARVTHLGGFVDQIQAARQDVDNFNASPEVMQQLAALGYVGGVDDGGPMDLSNAPDARQQAALIARVEEAQRLARTPKSARKAEAAMRTILADYPAMGEMRVGLANLLRQQRRLKEAEQVLAEGIEHQPKSTALRATLAEVLAQQNRYQEAYDLAKTIHEQVPGDDLARYAMLRYLRGMKRVPEAMATGKRWLDQEPDNHGLQALVGEMEVLYGGDKANGEKLLRASLVDDVPRSNVNRTLAMLLFSRGDIAGAAQHLEAEVAWFPHRPDIRLELGNTYMKLERWDDAAAEYAALTEMRPNSPDPRRLWSQAVLNSGDHQAAADILAPALEKFPDDPWVLLLHANTLEKLGRSEEGRKVFEEARSLHTAKRDALEKEMGVPLLETPNEEAGMDADLPVLVP